MLLLIILSYVSISPPPSQAYYGVSEGVDKGLYVSCLTRQREMEETAILHGARTLPEDSPRHPAKVMTLGVCMYIWSGDRPWDALFQNPPGPSWQEDFRAKGYRLN